MLLNFFLWFLILSLVLLIFSYNAIMALFFFVVVSFILCLILLLLNIEFISLLILLIYLGGILVFFIFSTIMLNINYHITWNKIFYLLDYAILQSLFITLICCSKVTYLVLLLLENITIFSGIFTQDYKISSIQNSTASWHISDAFSFIRFYGDFSLHLLLIALILFFVIIGIISICYNTNNESN